MENGFVVNFVGNTSGLTTATETAADALTDLNQKAQQTGRQTSEALVNVGKAAQQAGREVVTAHHQMTGASQQARYAVIDLGHMVRDLPYALSNPSILAGPFDRMTQALIQAKNETGGFKGAISGMASAISGGAGILIGVELLTSAIALFGGEIFGTSNKTEDFKIVLDNLDASLKKVSTTVDELKGSLDFSNKLGALNTEIFGLPKGLDLQGQVVQLREAKVQVQDIVTDLFHQQVELESQIENSTENALSPDALQSLKDQLKSVTSSYEENNKKLQQMTETESILYRQEALQKIKDQEEANKKAEEERNKALAAYKKQLEAERIALEEHMRMMKGVLAGGIAYTPIPQQFHAQAVALTPFKENQDWVKIFEHQLENQTIKPRFNIAPEIHLDPKKALINAQVLEFSAKVRGMLENSMQSAFVGFGEGIGQAIAGGSLGDAFKSIAGVVGDFVEGLGKELITTSTAVKAFKLALQTLFASPAAAIGVGIGLVAIGALIKAASAKKSVKGFAQGGVISGPTLGLIGEGSGTSASNPEIVAPLDKLKNFLNPGGGSVNVSGEFRLHGHDLVAAVAKELKSQGRDFGR